MDWDLLKRRGRAALKRVADAIDPAARVVSEVGEFVSDLQRPFSPLGVATAVARGVTTINDWAESRQNGPSIGTHFGERTSSITRWVVPVLTDLADEELGGDDYPHLYFNRWEAICTLSEEGPYFYRADPVYRHACGEIGDSCLRDIRAVVFEELRTRLPRILDAALHTDDSESVLDAVELDGLPSPRADEVYDATLPLLGSGRCILLNGDPGTGKTRMARYLAGRFAGQTGRILSLRFDLSPGMDEYEIGMIMDVLQPEVVLVDDLDKHENDLGNTSLERMRSGSRVVILTANNATEVLDGSLLRPGRVDEMFQIDDIGVDLIAPEWMRRLDPDTLERISTWPAADLEEVRLRLEARGPDRLGLDELELRMEVQVHSGGRIFRSSGGE